MGDRTGQQGGPIRLEKRGFLNVHGKKGSSCPKCGDIIRTVSFSRHDTFYCPKCR
ncbi:hypothetical protein IBX73_00900 [candidate division WOR-3 bacterium]|nr:hypothetical protein [candidate division WOR-3 bacterium]